MNLKTLKLVHFKRFIKNNQAHALSNPSLFDNFVSKASENPPSYQFVSLLISLAKDVLN